MKSKMVGLFAIVMMALMVAGVAYSVWTDSVAINVTATTGDVEFRILDFGVCSQSGELIITGPSGGEYESIDVSISNTYPGCWAYFCLLVKNTGTISVKLYRIRIVYTGGNSDWMDYYYFAIPTGDQWCQIGPPVYYNYTLTWWSQWRYYDGELNIPDFTIGPSQTYVLGGYFKLSDNAPQWENNAINVRIDLEVVQAVP
ncbi:MAG: hypothetical protein QW146_03325 [Candidatus Bathyarchaeia archaeon]